jgi:hypothetical protein
VESSEVWLLAKVFHKGIRVKSETSAIGRAVVADFFFDGVHVKISVNEVIWDIPRSVHDHAKGL